MDAVKHRPLSLVSDERFEHLITHSVYEKFLTSTLSPDDRQAFAGYLGDARATYYKSDFTAIAGVRPYRGMYVAPTVTLIRDKGGRREVVAVKLDTLMIAPGDKDAWDTAKFFVLQGAAYSMLFTEHPNLHFPYDAINAITKSSVPMDHLIFRLLRPHLRFQLQLNKAVLEFESRVITDWRPTLYAPFTANSSDGLLDLFVAGYRGVAGNPGYPPYQFRRRPKPVHGDDGIFLERYYETVLGFTQKIAAEIPPNDEYTSRWAGYIARWIPGFPGPDEIFKAGVLEEVLAGLVWDMSIGHVVDHNAFCFDVTPEEKYLRLRLRIPPPTSLDSGPTDPRHVTRWVDRLKARIAHKVFFEPSNVTRLVDVRYDFDDARLEHAAEEFRVALRRTEAEMPVKCFIKLDEISASIQY